MSSSEKLAVAAHLHVLLRRKTGRVTDTEWLASNRDYAAEIIRFAREKAAEDGHADIGGWADKLEKIMALPDQVPRAPLLQQVADAVRARQAAGAALPSATALHLGDAADAVSGFQASTWEREGGQPGVVDTPFDPAGPRYMKGLR
jgi:hypothetical protein